MFVFAEPAHPKWFVGASVSDDGRFVFITLEEARERTAHETPPIAFASLTLLESWASARQTLP